MCTYQQPKFFSCTPAETEEKEILIWDVMEHPDLVTKIFDFNVGNKVDVFFKISSNKKKKKFHLYQSRNGANIDF